MMTYFQHVALLGPTCFFFTWYPECGGISFPDDLFMILDPPVYAQHFVDTRRSTGFRKRITFDVNEKFDRETFVGIIPIHSSYRIILFYGTFFDNRNLMFIIISNCVFSKITHRLFSFRTLHFHHTTFIKLFINTS